jgi:hypothetical protein
MYCHVPYMHIVHPQEFAVNGEFQARENPDLSAGACRTIRLAVRASPWRC